MRTSQTELGGQWEAARIEGVEKASEGPGEERDPRIQLECQGRLPRGGEFCIGL